MHHVNSFIDFKKIRGCLTLAADGQAVPLYAGNGDYPGVIRVLRHLQEDIARVTNIKPELLPDVLPAARECVVAGTLGKNSLLDRWAEQGLIDVRDVAGKWEACLIQVVEQPVPGCERCLVIAGSDKRGTMFGIFELSVQLGVSPWYWWADVPVKTQSAVYVLPGRYLLKEPAVKYRGIFINDEAPALMRWVEKQWGWCNHFFYEKVFELLLRLKANYLWPAMWEAKFADDDPLNAVLADEYGIVMGTSHHEPMMRAHKEWLRYGRGAWDYASNAAVLEEFWKQGIARMGSCESIVTLGMRGDGDEAMPGGFCRSLLQNVIARQRELLGEVTGKPPEQIPQVWVVYKEVQAYLDLGMEVPEDVTLMLCDDNWGNIRRLPAAGAKPRAGGYGLYYHFDYVGGPRNYKWLNTNPLPRIWEQLHLALRYGVDRIWIVNVGDIKPMELPIEFFLDYARDPEAFPAACLDTYPVQWAAAQFGAEQAPAIGRMLSLYPKYNARRKPELLAPDTYSLVHFREAEQVVSDYNNLAAEAERIYADLPAAYRDAFYQLVLYPVKACANLHALYAAAGRNALYAAQGRAAANDLAAEAEALFAADAEYTDYYNRILSHGKWEHMMDQTHIGYTYWQQPEKNSMPAVRRCTVPPAADMGIALEGSEEWWPAAAGEARLPDCDAYAHPVRYFEVFNRGQEAFDCTIRVEAGAAWLHTDTDRVRIEKEQRIFVGVDPAKAPAGVHRACITVTGPHNRQVVIRVVFRNPGQIAGGFWESGGYISIEAAHYARAVCTAPFAWLCIPGLGKTLDGMTPLPVTAPAQVPGEDSPRLEYDFYTQGHGSLRVYAYLSPTCDFLNAGGLRYALSVDAAPPQIVNMHADASLKAWEQSVRDNINLSVSVHEVSAPGKHVLKFRMVDPGIVLQKLVVVTGEGALPPCYLGPPESCRGE